MRVFLALLFLFSVRNFVLLSKEAEGGEGRGGRGAGGAPGASLKTKNFPRTEKQNKLLRYCHCGVLFVRHESSSCGRFGMACERGALWCSSKGVAL